MLRSIDFAPEKAHPIDLMRELSVSVVFVLSIHLFLVLGKSC